MSPVLAVTGNEGGNLQQSHAWLRPLRAIVRGTRPPLVNPLSPTSRAKFDPFPTPPPKPPHVPAAPRASQAMTSPTVVNKCPQAETQTRGGRQEGKVPRTSTRLLRVPPSFAGCHAAANQTLVFVPSHNAPRPHKLRPAPAPEQGRKFQRLSCRRVRSQGRAACLDELSRFAQKSRK